MFQREETVKHLTMAHLSKQGIAQCAHFYYYLIFYYSFLGDDEKWSKYRYQNTNETVVHLIAREGGSIDHLQKLPNESLMEPNGKGT